MIFSYTVNHRVLLRNISLPLEKGRVYLITGVENANLGLLGGIFAQLIPVRDYSKIFAIQALINNYTGELEVTDGALPKTAAYVGTVPERHFLFARVEEEVIAELGDTKNFGEKLLAFGLSKNFLRRKIATLSGGEKMKVALTIAFAKQCEGYIFHGVIPWLDRAGRKALLAHIANVKASGASVIIIEHEIQPLLCVVDARLFFDGTTLHAVNIREDVEPGMPALSLSYYTEQCQQYKKNVLEMRQVDFSYIQGSALLCQISLDLFLGRKYVLLGENGAGKSTIAQMVFRVLQPQRGEIFLSAQPLQKYTRTELNQRICYLGQFPLQQIILSTVGEYRKQLSDPIIADWFDQYLAFPDEYPISLLSFLQLKILCLLSALSRTTELIILDEPTWGLDRDGKNALWQLLDAIAKRQGVALLVITHDLELLKVLQPEIFWLNHGQIKYFSNVDQFKLCPDVTRYFGEEMKIYEE